MDILSCLSGKISYFGRPNTVRSDYYRSQAYRLNFIEQYTYEVTYCINNMENWFAQSEVRSSCKEQWLVITPWTSHATRGVGRICRGLHRAPPSFLVAVSSKEDVVQLPIAGSSLIISSRGVQKTGEQSQEKQFQSQQLPAVVLRICLGGTAAAGGSCRGLLCAGGATVGGGGVAGAGLEVRGGDVVLPVADLQLEVAESELQDCVGAIIEGG